MEGREDWGEFEGVGYPTPEANGGSIEDVELQGRSLKDMGQRKEAQVHVVLVELQREQGGELAMADSLRSGKEGS